MEKQANNVAFFKLVAFSLIGVFMFFIPITIADKTTIPLDHLVSYLKGFSQNASSI